MTTDKNKLPQHNGRPVPWVTRWTNEVANDRYSLALERDRTITYADRNNNHDAHGILWQREGISRGGEPDWRTVSTYRQRASMQRRLCQVCGDKIPPGPIRWLMPIDDGYQTYEGVDGVEGMLTWNPPTCDGCVDLALSLCPHLKAHGYQILKVLDYEYWGVSGLTMIEMEGIVRPVQAIVPFEGDEDLAPFDADELRDLQKRVMAQQGVAKLGKYVVDEIHPGKSSQERGDDFLTKLMAEQAEQWKEQHS